MSCRFEEPFDGRIGAGIPLWRGDREPPSKVEAKLTVTTVRLPTGMCHHNNNKYLNCRWSYGSEPTVQQPLRLCPHSILRKKYPMFLGFGAYRASKSHAGTRVCYRNTLWEYSPVKIDMFPIWSLRVSGQSPGALTIFRLKK